MKYSDISKICQSVDLYEAIKKQNPQGKWIPWSPKGSYSSGLDCLVNSVNSVLDDELKSLSLTSADLNYFFEFSILPTVLDPESAEELECFSFLRGDKEFENIFTPLAGAATSTYEQVINDILDSKGISVYHHPNFLFDIWANGSDPLTVTEGLAKGKRNILSRFEKAKTIMMKRSYVETLDVSRNFYSSSPTPSIYNVQNYLHDYLRTKIINSEKTYFISFPIVGAKSSNQLPQNIVCNRKQDVPIQGIGSFFMYIESSRLNISIVNKICESLFVSVGELGRLFSVNYLFNLGLQLQEKARRESIKSAISAIMSRNMSHNLGSHYMYYTKAYLENMAITAGDIAPDIRGAAKVLGYVQARMDYLATVISNDKYPYGAVNFKSQIYDELTVDDFSHRHFLGDKNKRTTNFLLTNLIYSENFTRPDVRSDEKIESNCDKLFLHVKYSPDGEKYYNFTGTWHEISIEWVDEEVEKAQKENLLPLPTITSEQETKNLLSSLNIALPGGSMSCHAFFNVVENFIRNSAKYLRNDIDKNEGLICTLAIRPNADNGKFVDIIIYDNKKNANKIVDKGNELSLYDQIIRKLSSLVIIDEQNKISKEDKGFKEMLFSSIWMRAYMFGDKTYADIVADINQTVSGNKKLDLIERYGFSLVKVLDNSEGDVTVFSRIQECNEDANLGLLITLPTYNQIEHFSLTGDRVKDINAMLNTMADIVEVDKMFLQSEFNHVFTHSLFDENETCKNTLEKYKFVIKQRFPNIEQYSISFGEDDAQESSYEQTEKENPNYCIYFCRHMDTQRDASEFEGYAYADSISGGNFTITMLDLFRNGIQGGIYKSDEDEMFSLKIKESALTRITLVDERLYNSTKESEYPWLGLKNIRILNYDDNSDLSNNQSLSTLFVGNSFVDKKDQTHFLSIHLGLIEKILKNSNYVNTLIDNNLGADYTKEPNLLSYKRVTEFMRLLRDFFGGNDSDNLYIAVHSGRGNYSKELEGPLCTYPFISLSALENAYKNSKYQLAQLLYNTVFIGKGLANEQNTSSS